ncbi:hypothetical protein ACFC18_16605 [Streptomyces sp. NPDC056121]|jgi:hypothetical protein|uniref:Integrase n=1 Tax=Streptomyces sp. NBC_00119 TaxID=2975659 RepID=A0AAU1UEV9_9ACTN|nr:MULTISPECIES: hypothetical protein [Streptomyces]WSE14129.1 hypothetical protein OG518_12830 [Streptomyces sp. NBC_01397]MCX4646414.1 hypothetical protein [Streptomyces sp. NBC_01446]MCX5080740.1 hypothetical protein [Streptomyces sp. NBC_00401]MCX5319038.1 hypothetical protein [Streptomyces sp. NBC_00120]MCX5436352.1 hypothetical protein [Streptomyces sp. NBC_00063]
MRRVTINKPVAKTSTTRRQQQEDAAAERRHDRPEVRKDIRRTWWPDE